MKSTMLLIARTDSESGKLISSNIDIADHEFIVGTITSGTDSLAQTLSDAEASGATGAEVDALEKQWTSSHEMCTFSQGKPCFRLFCYPARHFFKLSKRRSINLALMTRLERINPILMLCPANPTRLPALLRLISWENQSSGIGTVRKLYLVTSIDTYHYSIAPRTREGYYHYTGGVEVSNSIHSLFSMS